MSETGGQHSAGGPQPVLLVEADRGRAQVLSALLAGIDTCQTTQAATVVDALQRLKEKSFSLVIANTSISRPNDGVRLAKTILLGQAAHTPMVMMVTSEGSPVVVQECVRAGVVDYLLFPCTSERFTERITAALARRPGLDVEMVTVATPYLGPAARVFIEQQIKAHMENLRLDTLSQEHLPELLHWVHLSARVIIRDKAEELTRRLESAFNVKRTP
jgi:CheY-like chemotaxis protein